MKELQPRETCWNAYLGIAEDLAIACQGKLILLNAVKRPQLSLGRLGRASEKMKQYKGEARM